MKRTSLRRGRSRKELMPPEVYEAVMIRARLGCEAKAAYTCTRRAEHWHHRQLRSRGGAHTVPNGLAVCHACHEWIHQNPARATELGFMVSSWADPAEVPIVKPTGRFLLTEDGKLQKIEVRR